MISLLRKNDDQLAVIKLRSCICKNCWQ